MALRNIITKENDILGKRAKEVTEVNDRILMILDDMLETMREFNGLGIAAPQVGVLRRMFIVEVEDQLVELINPEILKIDGCQKSEEGCLSVPGIIGAVERPAYVKMKGLNRHGDQVVVEGTELMAVALCHEYDHLEGILFVEKATDLYEVGDEQPEEEQD